MYIRQCGLCGVEEVNGGVSRYGKKKHIFKVPNGLYTTSYYYPLELSSSHDPPLPANLQKQHNIIHPLPN